MPSLKRKREYSKQQEINCDNILEDLNNNDANDYAMSEKVLESIVSHERLHVDDPALLAYCRKVDEIPDKKLHDAKMAVHVLISLVIENARKAGVINSNIQRAQILQTLLSNPKEENARKAGVINSNIQRAQILPTLLSNPKEENARKAGVINSNIQRALVKSKGRTYIE
jgi:hypothetical protein